jgi:hypothetical protein
MHAPGLYPRPALCSWVNCLMVVCRNFPLAASTAPRRVMRSAIDALLRHTSATLRDAGRMGGALNHRRPDARSIISSSLRRPRCLGFWRRPAIAAGAMTLPRLLVRRIADRRRRKGWAYWWRCWLCSFERRRREREKRSGFDRRARLAGTPSLPWPARDATNANAMVPESASDDA